MFILNKRDNPYNFFGANQQKVNDKELLPPTNKFAKVMFSHLSVSHSVHREGGCIQGVCIQGCLHPVHPGVVHPGGLGRPSIGYYSIRSMSGQYASYWNAFLYYIV